MNFKQFLGVICPKNLRESVIASPLWGAYKKLSRAILNLTLSETFINEHDSFRQSQKKCLVVVKVKLVQLAKDDSHIKSSPSCSWSQTTHSVEMEKFKAPPFTGKAIDNPEFKHGWCTFTAITWDDGYQQIKQKVDLCQKNHIKVQGYERCMGCT